MLEPDFKSVPLVRQFLEHRDYSPEFTRELIALARGRTASSWELRCLAILMLENQVLRLPPADSEESASLLKSLGIRAEWPELRTRLQRLARVHQGIRGSRTSPAALADFLYLSRHECKLTLARYLFTPEEVAERILSLLRRSRGLPYWAVRGRGPEPVIGTYEKRILDHLQLDGQVYWTGDDTPSAINSLVEYPLGTVVLVIKLPGSDCEFELKRGGIRGPEPLSVRYFRAAHRLYGGSPGTSNDAEARAALRLAELCRAVHGQDPPISSTVSMSYVQTVPGWRGEEHLLTYLTDPDAFGKGFRDMREAMEDAVNSFEDGRPDRSLPGIMGLTVRFLRYMPPRQALLKGSTSFRLDLLDRYLSPDGPREYFTEGLGVAFTFDDARRFANDLLEEVLGVVQPPKDPGDSYEEYLRRALSVPANRRRADRLFLQHLRAAGQLWGTLAATGGHSRGESFVPRNVGLKSRWREGEWITEIIFMDHDILRIPGGPNQFDPKKALPGMQLDEGYLFEDEPRGERSRGVEGCLRRIYQVSREQHLAGIEALNTAAAEAYRKTRSSLANDPAVRRLFGDGFAERLELWDALVRRRLDAACRGASKEDWERIAAPFLAEQGCGPRMTEEWTFAADQNLPFLQRYHYLFDPKYRAFSRSNKQSAG